jgi:glycosyltransferase involved in cell wall biosynthesis
MNLVQVCHQPFPSLGGPAKTYQQFHEAAGVRAIGFVLPEEQRRETPVVPLAVTVPVVGGKVGRYFYAPASRLQEAEEAVLAADFVFLHGLFTHPPAWAAALCAKHGVPYAIALHGYFDPWAMQKSSLVKRIWMHQFGNRILAGASAVICATQREADKVASRMSGVRSIRVIPWACEIPDQTRIAGRRPALRRELGLTDTDRVLVYFGRLHSMKRPLETLRRVAAHRSPNLKLLMIGPDDDVSRNQLEAEARRLGWPGLRMVGAVFGEKKFDYLGAGDAYISLSSRENFNYSLAEAMAAGIPPIVSPGNDLGWEFVGEGFSWHLNSDSGKEVHAALDAFVAVPAAELVSRGAAAREWVRGHLSLNRLRDRLDALIPGVKGGAVPAITRRAALQSAGRPLAADSDGG